MVWDQWSKMARKQIYHGESCEGMIVANFFVDDKVVQAYFVDGDIGSTKIKYHVERNNGNYQLVEEEILTPEPFAGQSKPKTRKLKAEDIDEAVKAMIDSIVKPYVNAGKYSMPVEAGKLRSGLEGALLAKKA